MMHYKKETLIYIEPLPNKEFNKAIIENYDFIIEAFSRIDIPFIYLPKLLKDNHFNRVLKYNRPHLKDSHQIHTEKLYHVISQSLNLKVDEPTLIYLSENGEAEHQFKLSSPNLFSSGEALHLFTDNIKQIITPVIEDEEEHIRFRSIDILNDSMLDTSFDESPDEYLLDDPPPLSKKEPAVRKSYQKLQQNISIDDLFEEEAFNIPDNLQKQIEALSEAGYLSHLIKYLEILQQNTRQLSRLKITNEYAIYLMDYEMKEVKMSPLPKALYLLFLNHPEGIAFKSLPDYRDELWRIYKNISQRENPIKARQSIRKLTDPFDNSVHEKCSRIRAAFLSVVAEHIAQNYYITGERGEAKKVALNRELVIYSK